MRLFFTLNVYYNSKNMNDWCYISCSKCLSENDKMLKEKGYGYGYIGERGNCRRHDATEKSIRNPNPTYFMRPNPTR